MGFISEKAYAEGYENGYKAGQKDITDKACEWLSNIDFDMRYWNPEEGFCSEQFIEDFKKAMEE